MNIPQSILQTVSDNANPLDNHYFSHAESSINALNKVTGDLYCYDYMSNMINALERVYKGFLLAATKECDWYQLPTSDYIGKDHDILKLLQEIKSNFPSVFPREDRDAWRNTKSFLNDLRREYSLARYDSYPTYDEFSKVRDYVNNQYDIVKDYIEQGRFVEDNKDSEYEIDY